MQLTMSRAGRKRAPRVYLGPKPGPRIDYRLLAAEQPHRRWLLPFEEKDDNGEPRTDLRLSEKAETWFGRANLSGEVSDEQYEAGQRYKVVAQEYLSSIGAPRGEFPMGKGYACKGEPQCGLQEGSLPCECRRRKSAYDSAFEALAEAGHKAQVQVSHCAVHGRVAGNVKQLLRGLELLVKHFGVGRRR